MLKYSVPFAFFSLVCWINHVSERLIFLQLTFVSYGNPLALRYHLYLKSIRYVNIYCTSLNKVSQNAFTRKLQLALKRFSIT